MNERRRRRLGMPGTAREAGDEAEEEEEEDENE